MTPDQVSKLSKSADGRPMITLMTDPTQDDPITGEPVGFLSLVGAGANLRTIKVAKAEGDNLDSGVPVFTASHGAVGEERATWWRSLFAPLLALPGLAMKALGGGAAVARKDGEPTDFNAALACEALERARWQASDALWEVIWNIMGDATITDKRTAIGTALDQFRAHVLTLVDRTPVAKAEDREALALAVKAAPFAPSEITRKAGKVISAANMDTIQSALTAMESARVALAALLTANEKAAKADPSSSPDIGADMDPAKIAALALAASTEAVKAAKAAGVTDAAKLTEIGDKAAAVVYKAAVGGPPQAAMPDGELARIIASHGDGSMSDPTGMISAVINRLTPSIDALVAKRVEAGVQAATKDLTDQVGELAIVLKGAGERGKDGYRPGLLDGLEHLSERVSKALATPAKPRGAGDPETTTVRKGADGPDPLKGSALDFTGAAVPR